MFFKLDPCSKTLSTHDFVEVLLCAVLEVGAAFDEASTAELTGHVIQLSSGGGGSILAAVLLRVTVEQILKAGLRFVALHFRII
jgi:hypothetical protein